MLDCVTQEWLWCETWCGNATKQYAKTIDLCNNPLTKEPKLQGARRIVNEWPAFDKEARSFTAQVFLCCHALSQSFGLAMCVAFFSLTVL